VKLDQKLPYSRCYQRKLLVFWARILPPYDQEDCLVDFDTRVKFHLNLINIVAVALCACDDDYEPMG
jgi:hypothetical protein